jgi:hypothetical protein
MKFVLPLSKALLLAVPPMAMGATTKYTYTQKSSSAGFDAYSYDGCQYDTLSVSAYNEVAKADGQGTLANVAYVYFERQNYCVAGGTSSYFWAQLDVKDGLKADPQKGATLDFEGTGQGEGRVCDASGCTDFYDGIPISLHATLAPKDKPEKYTSCYKDQTVQSGGALSRSKSRGTYAVSLPPEFAGSVGGVPIPSPAEFDTVSGWIAKYNYGYLTIEK